MIQALSANLDYIASLSKTGATFLLALLTTAVISSGIVMVGSAFSTFLTFRPLLVRLNLLFAAVAASALLISALSATGILIGGVAVVGQIGDIINLKSKFGDKFLAIEWVMAGLSTVTGAYWFMVWLVEVRKTAFVRMSRRADQIGNWRGIFGEVWGNIRANRERKMR